MLKFTPNLRKLSPFLKVYAENILRSLEFKVDMKVKNSEIKKQLWRQKNITRVFWVQEKLSESSKFLLPSLQVSQVSRWCCFHARFLCSDARTCSFLSLESLKFFRKFPKDQENFGVAFECWRWILFVDVFRLLVDVFLIGCLRKDQVGTGNAVINCHQRRKILISDGWRAKISDDVSLMLAAVT